MSDRPYFEHFATGDPSRLDRWYCCECCGYPTLGLPNNDEFCEICDWYDDHSGDGGAGPESLPEARENFRAHLTKYRPGSSAFRAQNLEGERSAKRELISAYEAYMAEPDVRRRSPLWSKVRRLSENFPLGDPPDGS